MKRVLSIMLTLMLAFTMFSGITASAEYETVTSFTGGNDFSTIFNGFATSSGFTMQNVSSSFTSLASVEKTAVAADVAAGVTSSKVLALTPSGSADPTLRFKWGTAATPNELMRVKFKFYFVGETGAAYDIQMQPQQGTGTSSAGGAFTLSAQPANQWIQFDQVVTPNKGNPGIQGVKFTIKKNGTTAAYPTTIYLDGNFSVEKVKVAESDASKVAADKDALTLGNTNGISKNLTLPTTGANGSTITWATSDASVIETNGTIHPGDEAKSATLTATLTLGSVTDTKTFNIVVSGLPTVTLAECFKGNMVIQRNQPIDVWGTSTKAGTTVTITLGENTASTVTDASGEWKVTLPAMTAQTGLTLNMSCNDAAATSKTVSGIAIGEVIMAAGQSNMNWTLANIPNYQEYVPDSTVLSRVRVLNFMDTGSHNYSWMFSTASNYTSRTGIGLIVGYNIAAEENITVGVIDVAIGGAQIESFLSPETLASRSMYDIYTLASDSETDMAKRKKQPAGLYNSWFQYIKGIKIGSALWYQGENNANQTIDKTTDIYYYKQLDLFNQWREEYGNPNMPIAVVQLAPYGSTSYDYVKIRQSQLDITNDMENVYLVTTADVGPTATDDAIHPSNKGPVAARATAVLRHALLGKYVEYSAPTYEKMTVTGNEATLTFSRAYGYNLLHTSGVAGLSDTSGAAGYSRFGRSGGERWEFRLGTATAQQVTATRNTTADLVANYPGVVAGYASDYTFVKLDRVINTGFVRISQLVANDQIAIGDKFRITVKVYPTDMMLDADTADTNNTVESFKWTFKGQRNGSSGHGSDETIELIPNQWNTIVLEDVADGDGVNGIYLNTGYADGTAFPATVFFDGKVTLEKLAASDAEAKSLKTSDGEAVTGFEVAGKDGVFYPATATIVGNTITVSAEEVASPKEVRYCYVMQSATDSTTLGGNVVNAAGIPMGPFKAQVPNVAIESVTGSGYTYTVNLKNSAYNVAPGYVVAALYDGDEFIQMKTVEFTIDERKDTTATVTFNPATAPTNPSVKIMAWKDMTTIVPYCAAVDR